MARKSSSPEDDTPEPLEFSDQITASNATPMKEAISSFIAARVELASIEVKEAAAFAARKSIQGVILGTSLFFTWTLVLAGLTGVLTPHATKWLDGKITDLPGWAAVLFALAILHGIVALICLICLKKKPSAPLFELTKQEIENDKQWLKKNK